ncbi:MAG: tetratricopeptide repeat protein [Planctomycetota bacterium]|jgi:serine/threonine protein kinase
MSEIHESKIRQLFDLAMDKPADEREEFLLRMCGEGELLDRVRELLRAHDDAGDFLRQPTAAPAPDPAHAETAEEPGTVIGNYKLLQQIGEGGMGTVWMAEQFEPVRRKVALKIIKLGMDSKQVVVRFEAERQALALMDHPNIAKVLDGGMTGGGRPYFVMELVKGVPITEFCDEAKFGIRQRLELFTNVCQAVQHAHQKGIIHRDIKPTNVLVTLHDGVPVAKVIDFGIAKATNQQLTQKTLFTEYQQILGTPEYMAPEQAAMSGLDVDTRADVYSLGALLYELLTGTKPFDLKTLLTRGYEELLRTIREDDPPKPSTRASATEDDTGRISLARQLGEGQLGRELRGDLDWIVVKAMEKDRTRRYETANGLAADIRRYLEDEPVGATPPSATYRVKKFVRRNRGPVIAAALVATALVLGVVGTAAGMVRSMREAERAERAERATARELDRANAVKEVITSMLTGITPEQAQGVDTTLLKRIVDDTAMRLQKREIADEVIAAELHMIVGHAYSAIGAYDLAEQHLPRAVELRERLFGAAHYDTLEARMQLALLRTNQGRSGEAVRIQEEVLPTLERLKGPEDKVTIGHKINLANSYWKMLELERAERLLTTTYATGRRALGEEDEYVLNAAGNLGLVYRSLGRPKDAEAQYLHVLELRRRTEGPEHPATISAMANLAAVKIDLREFAEAERLFVEARALQEKVLGREHPGTLTATINLASLYQVRGRTEEAEALLDEVAAIAARTLSKEHPLRLESDLMRACVYALQGRRAETARLLIEGSAIARRVLGEESTRGSSYMERSADTLALIRRYPEAHRLYARLLEIRRKQFGADNEKTLAIMVKYAGTSERVGERTESEVRIAEARRRLTEKFGEADPRTDAAARVAARIKGARGNWEEAESIYKEILGRAPPGEYETAELLKEMSDFYVSIGRLKEAEARRRQALAIIDKTFGADNVRALLTRREIADLQKGQGRFEEAQQEYRDVIDAMRVSLGPESPLIVEAECQLGIAFGAQRKFRQAERVLLDAQKRAETLWGRGHVLTAQVYRCLGMVYMDWRRAADAERVLRIAVEIQADVLGTPTHEDLVRLGLLAMARGDEAEAEKHYRAALESARKTLGNGNSGLVQLLLQLAGVLRPQRRLDETEKLLTEAIAIAEQTLPKAHALRMQALNQLAGLRSQQGRPEEAASLIKQVITISREAHGENSIQTLSTISNLGNVLNSLGRYEESVRILTDGHADAVKKMGAINPLTGTFMVMLGSAYYAQGQWADAERSFRQAQAAYRMFNGPQAIPTHVASLYLGWSIQSAGRSEEALKVFEPLLASMRKTLPAGHPIFRSGIEALIHSYAELDRIEDARPLVKELVPLFEKAIEAPHVASGTLDGAASLYLRKEFPDSHDPARALELAGRACEMAEATKNSSLWQHLRTLAKAQFQTGDRMAARKTLERAFKLAPKGRMAELEELKAEFENSE